MNLTQRPNAGRQKGPCLFRLLGFGVLSAHLNLNP